MKTAKRLQAARAKRMGSTPKPVVKHSGHAYGGTGGHGGVHKR